VDDLVIGFSKTVVSGFILATVGCYQGLSVEGGTAGVAALRLSRSSCPR
jgi:ABC-type transporter Mla maintaining outer membrane lipid asymmetry permease subunit MlaE